MHQIDREIAEFTPCDGKRNLAFSAEKVYDIHQ
jgi:hypothetical protein